LNIPSQTEESKSFTIEAQPMIQPPGGGKLTKIEAEDIRNEKVFVE
jgi:hypothetical protein